MDCLINQNLSNIKSNKNIKFIQSFSNKSFQQHISNYQNKELKNLVNLFFNEKEINSKMKPIIEKLSTDEFELILFSYKLSLSCSLSNQDSIFSKMISIKFKEEIFDAYIPGAELFSDLFVELSFSITKYIEPSNKQGCGEGFYVCNCGEFYYNPYCGVPVSIAFCINCKKEIGGLDEILTKRGKDNYEKEIIRVYYDEKNQKAVEERGDLIMRYKDEWYDSILLKDFQKENEDKMNKDYKGIKCNNYILFTNENKQIRDLSQFSYRILSYIIYSNIFFNYLLEYISNNDLREKELVPLKEEVFKGEFTVESNDEEKSSANWEDYRIEILNNRSKDRNMEDFIC